eukprot:tig00000889_g5306.t2
MPLLANIFNSPASWAASMSPKFTKAAAELAQRAADALVEAKRPREAAQLLFAAGDEQRATLICANEGPAVVKELRSRYLSKKQIVTSSSSSLPMMRRIGDRWELSDLQSDDPELPPFEFSSQSVPMVKHVGGTWEPVPSTSVSASMKAPVDRSSMPVLGGGAASSSAQLQGAPSALSSMSEIVPAAPSREKSSGRKLDLTQGGRRKWPVEEIQKMGPASVRILLLNTNKLTSVPGAELAKLVKLKSLWLDRNELTTLPAEIGSLSNLQQLVVSNNRLKLLPPEVERLENLQQLDLHKNELSALPPEICSLPKLQQLDVRQNRLTTLPPQIRHLWLLRDLKLSENKLATLPAELGQLSNLRDLHVSKNQLTVLPAELGQLANLRELNVWENRLKALPPELGHLVNLQQLDVSCNKLMALPPELGNLTNLTVLDLSKNQLQALPPELGLLSSLQRLDASTNRLASLPSQLGQLANLEDCNLFKNQLRTLPPELERLTNLERLEVGCNRLNMDSLPPGLGRPRLEQGFIYNNTDQPMMIRNDSSQPMTFTVLPNYKR